MSSRSWTAYNDTVDSLLEWSVACAQTLHIVYGAAASAEERTIANAVCERRSEPAYAVVQAVARHARKDDLSPYCWFHCANAGALAYDLPFFEFCLKNGPAWACELGVTLAFVAEHERLSAEQTDTVRRMAQALYAHALTLSGHQKECSVNHTLRCAILCGETSRRIGNMASSACAEPGLLTFALEHGRVDCASALERVLEYSDDFWVECLHGLPYVCGTVSAVKYLERAYKRLPASPAVLEALSEGMAYAEDARNTEVAAYLASPECAFVAALRER